MHERPLELALLEVAMASRSDTQLSEGKNI
jgi:hypothetical protein